MSDISKALCAMIIIACSITGLAQDTLSPCKKLYDKNGLLVEFIFYSEGNNDLFR